MDALQPLLSLLEQTRAERDQTLAEHQRRRDPHSGVHEA